MDISESIHILALLDQFNLDLWHACEFCNTLYKLLGQTSRLSLLVFSRWSSQEVCMQDKKLTQLT